MSDRPPQGPPHGDGDDERDEEGVPDPPSPSTWAGKRSQSGAEEGSDHGLTDEIDEIERELSDDLPAEEPEDQPAEEEPAEEEPAEEEPEDEEPQAPEPVAEEEGTSDEEEEPEPAEDEPTSDQQGATIEADTLALADREEAQEAAMSGLRDRAATEAARRQSGTPTPTGPEPVVAPTEATEPESPPEAEAEAAQPAPAGPVDIGKAPSRVGVWARFVSASFLIIVSMATATAVSALVFLGGIAAALRPIAHVQKQLTPVENAKPETILILGSDKRAGETDKGRSDTTILLRIDPDQNAIRLLSIPRDLRVNIPHPGHGVDKFNAAYTYGGPSLTLRVVKNLTGLEINHIVNIDFTGFADAVNAIGCVYVDVDRHYYIPPNSGVAEIDIQAGYQRLCGLKALEYVRYRHTDNDLVRSARQQGFLQEARAQVPTSDLISPFSGSQRNKLIDIFTKYTSSDIQSTDTLITMAKLFFEARNSQVKELHFPAQLGGPTDPYVTANQKSIQAVINQFLGETPPPAANPPNQGGSNGHKGSGKPSKPPPPPAPPPMTDSTASGQETAAGIFSHEDTRYPIYYPTRIPPGAEISPSVAAGGQSRSFKIDGPGNDVFHGYKLVISHFNGAYYEYSGVSGTDWRDAPILDNPSETKTIDGRDYLLYWDGPRLQMVAWKTNQASYWVTNDLLESLTPGEMLSMATSTRPYTK